MNAVQATGARLIASFQAWRPPRSGYVLTGNPEAEATLQRQRGLVAPNAVALSPPA